MSITIVETTYNLSIPQNFLNSLYNLYILSIIFFICIFILYLTLNFYELCQNTRNFSHEINGIFFEKNKSYGII